MVTRIGPKKPVRIFISHRREDKNLSQEQLANRIGTTKGSISRWENNERDITLGALGAIAEALGCTVEDLFRDPAQPDVPHSDYYIRIAPVFETADPRYAWLNGVLAVGCGHRTATGIRHSVFAIL